MNAHVYVLFPQIQDWHGRPHGASETSREKHVRYDSEVLIFFERALSNALALRSCQLIFIVNAIQHSKRGSNIFKREQISSSREGRSVRVQYISQETTLHDRRPWPVKVARRAMNLIDVFWFPGNAFHTPLSLSFFHASVSFFSSSSTTSFRFWETIARSVHQRYLGRGRKHTVPAII